MQFWCWEGKKQSMPYNVQYLIKITTLLFSGAPKGWWSMQEALNIKKLGFFVSTNTEFDADLKNEHGFLGPKEAFEVWPHLRDFATLRKNSGRCPRLVVLTALPGKPGLDGLSHLPELSLQGCGGQISDSILDTSRCLKQISRAFRESA